MVAEMGASPSFAFTVVSSKQPAAAGQQITTDWLKLRLLGDAFCDETSNSGTGCWLQ